MVVQNSGARIQPICLAIVRDFPECSRLTNPVRTARAKRSHLVCGSSVRVAKTFARSCVVQANRPIGKSNCLEQVERADAETLECVNGLLKGEADGALPRKVVDLVRLGFSDRLKNAAKISESH